RLPRLNIFELLGELGWVGGRRECLFAQDRRGLVLPVTVARGAAEAQNNHIGTVAPDDPDDIGKDAIVAPLLQSLLGRARETEIDCAREELLRTVNLPCVEQLLRSDNPQLRTLLAADQILAAFAARQRKVGRAHVASAREVS